MSHIPFFRDLPGSRLHEALATLWLSATCKCSLHEKISDAESKGKPGAGLKWSLWSLATWVILWFHEFVISSDIAALHLPSSWPCGFKRDLHHCWKYITFQPISCQLLCYCLFLTRISNFHFITSQIPIKSMNWSMWSNLRKLLRGRHYKLYLLHWLNKTFNGHHNEHQVLSLTLDVEERKEQSHSVKKSNLARNHGVLCSCVMSKCFQQTTVEPAQVNQSYEYGFLCQHKLFIHTLLQLLTAVASLSD